MADHNVNFSWSDTLRATFSPCLVCFSPNSGSTDSLLNFDPNIANDHSGFNPSRGRLPRARADELHGLLNDPITDDDNDSSRDGDTMSLHSNIGDPDRNRRRKKNRRGRRRKQADVAHSGGAKSITFFGFDLFGRRKPAIQLSDGESDDEDPIHRSLLRLSSARNPTSVQSQESQDATSDSQSTTTSGLGKRDSWGATTHLTFDSDASPLDPSVIDSMTPEELAAHVHAAEEERMAKENRRRRREKKEQARRRLKMEHQMEMEMDNELLKASSNRSPVPGGAFEGFQGSAEGGPLMYMPEEYGKFARTVNEFGDASATSISSGSSSITRLSKSTSRRPSPLSFPHPPSPGAHPEDEPAVDADFDGNLYNTRPLKPSTPSSDSKSRTSDSASQRSGRQYAAYSQPQDRQPPPPFGHDSPVPSSGTTTPRTKSKKKKATSDADPPPISSPPGAVPQTSHRSTQSRSSASSTTLPLSPPPSASSYIPTIAEASPDYDGERRLEAPPASEQELFSHLDGRVPGKVSGFEGYPMDDNASDAVQSNFPITGFGRSGSGFGAGFGSRAFRASDGSSSDHSGQGQGPISNQRADVGLAAMLARRGEF